jgi:hypothetical protein
MILRSIARLARTFCCVNWKVLKLRIKMRTRRKPRYI